MNIDLLERKIYKVKKYNFDSKKYEDIHIENINQDDNIKTLQEKIYLQEKIKNQYLWLSCAIDHYFFHLIDNIFENKDIISYLKFEEKFKKIMDKKNFKKLESAIKTTKKIINIKQVLLDINEYINEGNSIEYLKGLSVSFQNYDGLNFEYINPLDNLDENNLSNNYKVNNYSKLLKELSKQVTICLIDLDEIPKSIKNRDYLKELYLNEDIIYPAIKNLKDKIDVENEQTIEIYKNKNDIVKELTNEKENINKNDIDIYCIDFIIYDFTENECDIQRIFNEFKLNNEVPFLKYNTKKRDCVYKIFKPNYYGEISDVNVDLFKSWKVEDFSNKETENFLTEPSVIFKIKYEEYLYFTLIINIKNNIMVKFNIANLDGYEKIDYKNIKKINIEKLFLKINDFFGKFEFLESNNLKKLQSNFKEPNFNSESLKVTNISAKKYVGIYQSVNIDDLYNICANNNHYISNFNIPLESSDKNKFIYKRINDFYTNLNIKSFLDSIFEKLIFKKEEKKIKELLETNFHLNNPNDFFINYLKNKLEGEDKENFYKNEFIKTEIEFLHHENDAEIPDLFIWPILINNANDLFEIKLINSLLNNIFCDLIIFYHNKREQSSIRKSVKKQNVTKEKKEKKEKDIQLKKIKEEPPKVKETHVVIKKKKVDLMGFSSSNNSNNSSGNSSNNESNSKVTKGENKEINSDNNDNNNDNNDNDNNDNDNNDNNDNESEGTYDFVMDVENKSYRTLMSYMRKNFDNELFDFSGQNIKAYTRTCAGTDKRQPYILSRAQWKNVLKNKNYYEGLDKHIIKNKTGDAIPIEHYFLEWGSKKKKKNDKCKKSNIYICPRIWCFFCQLPISPFYWVNNKKCPKCGGQENTNLENITKKNPVIIRKNKGYWGNNNNERNKSYLHYIFKEELEKKGETLVDKTLRDSENGMYPGLMDPKLHPDKNCLPCCFRNPMAFTAASQKKFEECKKIRNNDIERKNAGKGSKKIDEVKKQKINTNFDIKEQNVFKILGPESFPLGNDSFAVLTNDLNRLLQPDIIDDLELIYAINGKRKQEYFFIYQLDNKPNTKKIKYRKISLPRELSNEELASYFVRLGTNNNEIQKNSFINVFEKLYNIDQKKQINIVDKICNDLSLFDFISLNNGNLIEIFRNNDDTIKDDDLADHEFITWIKKHNNDLIKLKIYKDDEENLRQIYKIYKGFENFKQYTRNENIVKNHEFYWDLFCRKDFIFDRKVNLIILEKDNCKEDSNINILCPETFYGRDFFDIEKETFFIVKCGDIYEPIIRINFSWDRIKSEEIDISFETGDNNKLDLLIKNFDKHCYKDEQKEIKNILDLNNIVKLIHDNGKEIHKFIIGKYCKIYGCIIKFENEKIYLPIFPSGINIDLMNDKDIKNMDYLKINKFSPEKYEKLVNELKLNEYYSLDKKIVQVLKSNDSNTLSNKKCKLEGGLLKNGEIIPFKNIELLFDMKNMISVKDYYDIDFNDYMKLNDNIYNEQKLKNDRVEYINNYNFEERQFKNIIYIFNNFIREYKKNKIQKNLVNIISNPVLLPEEKKEIIFESIEEIFNDILTFKEKDYNIDKLNLCYKNKDKKCSDNKLCVLENNKCKNIISKKNRKSKEENKELFLNKFLEILVRNKTEAIKILEEKINRPLFIDFKNKKNEIIFKMDFYNTIQSRLYKLKKIQYIRDIKPFDTKVIDNSSNIDILSVENQEIKKVKKVKNKKVSKVHTNPIESLSSEDSNSGKSGKKSGKQSGKKSGKKSGKQSGKKSGKKSQSIKINNTNIEIKPKKIKKIKRKTKKILDINSKTVDMYGIERKTTKKEDPVIGGKCVFPYYRESDGITKHYDCTMRHDGTGPVCPIDFNNEDYPELVKKKKYKDGIIQYTDNTPFGYCPYIDPENPEQYDEDSKYYYNRHKPKDKIKKKTCKSYYVNRNKPRNCVNKERKKKKK